MALWCFLAFTARFTRAIGDSFQRNWEGRGAVRSAEAEQALDARLVAGCEVGLTAETALATRRLLLEDVVQVALATAQLARARHLEALLRAPMGLHLRL